MDDGRDLGISQRAWVSGEGHICAFVFGDKAISIFAPKAVARSSDLLDAQRIAQILDSSHDERICCIFIVCVEKGTDIEAGRGSSQIDTGR